MTASTLISIYENNVFRISLNKDLSLLELNFLIGPDADHFRIAYNLAFDAAKNKTVKFWLTDATHIKVMERENQIWLKQKMSGLLTSNQLSKFAIVMSPECFVMTNPNQVYEKPIPTNEVPASGNIKVHFDKQAAYDWLLYGIRINQL